MSLSSLRSIQLVRNRSRLVLVQQRYRLGCRGELNSFSLSPPLPVTRKGFLCCRRQMSCVRSLSTFGRRGMKQVVCLVLSLGKKQSNNFPPSVNASILACRFPYQPCCISVPLFVLYLGSFRTASTREEQLCDRLRLNYSLRISERLETKSNVDSCYPTSSIT
jgi:hypothetical protein